MEKLLSIIREASSLMVDEGFKVSSKDGLANIVTSSDLAVQNFLKEKLSEYLPCSGFLCEEDDMYTLDQEYTWIIDPIDGTCNYARGIRDCAICVGLRHWDRMEKGVVFLPRTNEMFHAERGRGAFLNGRPIRVSERPFEDGLICTALAVYHKEHSKLCSDIIHEVFLQCNDMRRFGACAPELCYLALGHCELYFEYLLSPWDFAAASLILEEAGGCLCDLHGKPLDHTKPSGVLAANSRENLNRLVRIVESKL